MMANNMILGWELIFIVPFFLALLYLGLYVTTGLTFGDADADLDHDLDADADADADAHHGAGANHDFHAYDGVHHVHHGPDPHHGGHGQGHGHHGAHGNASFAQAVLSFFGIGRVPLSIVLMIYGLVWGTAGFVASRKLAESRFANLAEGASLVIAMVCAVVIAKLVVKLVERFVPLHQSSARRRHELMGLTGEAVFAIDEASGVVAVRDDSGELFQVACRLDTSRTSGSIAKGSRVKLVGYDARLKHYYGVPSELAAKVVSNHD